jgi:hypothetical protein
LTFGLSGAPFGDREPDMTETLGQADIGSRLYAGFQRFCAFLGKAGFGVFLLAAA